MLHFLGVNYSIAAIEHFNNEGEIIDFQLVPYQLNKELEKKVNLFGFMEQV